MEWRKSLQNVKNLLCTASFPIILLLFAVFICGGCGSFEKTDARASFDTLEDALISVNETAEDIAVSVEAGDIEFLILNHSADVYDQYIRLLALSYENQKVTVEKVSVKLSNKSWTETEQPFSAMFSAEGKSENKTLCVEIQKGDRANADNKISLKDGYILQYHVQQTILGEQVH